jgi:hypothetical protein
MRFGFERFSDVFSEVGEDVLLADDGGAVLEPQRGDRVDADRLLQSGAGPPARPEPGG